MMSQSPENGSQHCKENFPLYWGREPHIESQSPENGSQHCKAARAVPSVNLPAMVARRNPLKTGLSTARWRESGTSTRQSSSCRNPLKTGLSTARIQMCIGSCSSIRPLLRRNPLKTGLSTARRLQWTWWEKRWPGSCRNPLKTGLSTASCPAPIGAAVGSGSRRNPLKTGLSTASFAFWNKYEFTGEASQSPENGSQHCKDC